VTAATRDAGDLRALADQAGRELEDAPAEEIVGWAAETFGSRLAVATNLQDAVLVHLVATARPGVDTLFLDTGYHFAETIGTRDAVAHTYPIRLLDITPQQTVAEQDAEHGPRLYERHPDRCCALRKVAPLRRALAGYDAWITGLRRDEAPTRAGTPVVGWDEAFGLVKVSPLARWTADDLAAYAARHHVLVNPLVADGYPSIGCQPCTRRVAPGEDPRSGRWAGLAKTECGLHPGTSPAAVPQEGVTS
jgi:phosphoadenosine phosphosulfate reductase